MTTRFECQGAVSYMEVSDEGKFMLYEDHAAAMSALQESYKHRTSGLIVHRGVAMACSQAVADAFNVNESALSALREENERLRAALRQIEAIEDKTWGGDWDEIEEARAIATAALTPKEQGNE